MEWRFNIEPYSGVVIFVISDVLPEDRASYWFSSLPLALYLGLLGHWVCQRFL